MTFFKNNFVYGKILVLLIFVVFGLAACDRTTEADTTTQTITTGVATEDSMFPVLTLDHDLTTERYLNAQTPDFSDWIVSVWDDIDDLDADDVVIDSSTFDPNTAGSYDVVYTINDSHYGSDTETLTFTVSEHTGPWAVLNNETIQVTVGTTVNLMNNVGSLATIYDVADVTVVHTNNVDFSTIGQYEVEYTISEPGYETTMTIYVDVIDNVWPSIRLITNEVFMVENQPVDWAAYITNVSDNYDTLLEADVTIDTSNFINEVGTYTISYSISDSSGNTTTEYIAVTVREGVAPEITFFEDATTSFAVETNVTDFRYLVESLFVQTGDQTVEDIIIDSSAVNMDYPGVYEVIFTITDDWNYTTTETVNITVVDVHGPTITLDTTLQTTFQIDSIAPDWSSYVLSVTDDYDTTLTIADVEIDSSAENMSTVGTFNIVYTCTDNGGNTQGVILVITIQDDPTPVIDFNLNFDLTVNVFDAAPNLRDAIWRVIVQNGTSTVDDVVITGSVDMDIVADYTITYSLTDSAGYNTTETLVIRVVDPTNATITWNWDYDAEFALGTQLPDLKEMMVSVQDNYDQDLTLDDVVIDSSEVDMDTEGTYNVYFEITDSSGNWARYVKEVTVVEKSRIELIPHEGSLEVINIIKLSDGDLIFLEDSDELFIVKFDETDAIVFRTQVFDKTAVGYNSCALYDAYYILQNGNIIISGGYSSDEYEMLSYTLDVTNGTLTEYLECAMFNYPLDSGEDLIYFYSYYTSEFHLFDTATESLIEIINVVNDVDYITIEIDLGYGAYFILIEEDDLGNETATVYDKLGNSQATFNYLEDTYGFFENVFYVYNETTLDLDIYNLNTLAISSYEDIYDLVVSDNQMYLYNDITKVVTVLDDDGEEAFDTVALEAYGIDVENDLIYLVLNQATGSLRVYKASTGAFHGFLEGGNFIIETDDVSGAVYFVDLTDNFAYVFRETTNALSGMIRSNNDYAAFNFSTATEDYHVQFYGQSGTGASAVILSNLTDGSVATHYIDVEIDEFIDVVYADEDYCVFVATNGTSDYIILYDYDNGMFQRYGFTKSGNNPTYHGAYFGSYGYFTVISDDAVYTFNLTDMTIPSRMIDLNEAGYFNISLKVYFDAYEGQDILQVLYNASSSGTDQSVYYIGDLESGLLYMDKYTYEGNWYPYLLIKDFAGTDNDAIYAYSTDSYAYEILTGEVVNEMQLIYNGDSYVHVDSDLFEFEDFFNFVGWLQYNEDIYIY